MQIEDSMKGFVIKCFVFSAIFLFCWALLYKPIYGLIWSDRSQDSKSQADTYEKQVQRSEAVLSRSEAYAERLDRLVKLQEDNAARHARVLTAWEAQAGVK